MEKVTILFLAVLASPRLLLGLILSRSYLEVSKTSASALVSSAALTESSVAVTDLLSLSSPLKLEGRVWTRSNNTLEKDAMLAVTAAWMALLTSSGLDMVAKLGARES
eukprot:scaffold13376_cov295-Alexandrium_tamarense.AAC.1